MDFGEDENFFNFVTFAHDSTFLYELVNRHIFHYESYEIPHFYRNYPLSWKMSPIAGHRIWLELDGPSTQFT